MTTSHYKPLHAPNFTLSTLLDLPSHTKSNPDPLTYVVLPSQVVSLDETLLCMYVLYFAKFLLLKNFVSLKVIIFFFLLVLLYMANIWRAFDMNKNIVTQKFLTQNFVNEINVNYGICT